MAQNLYSELKYRACEQSFLKRIWETLGQSWEDGVEILWVSSKHKICAPKYFSDGRSFNPIYKIIQKRV